jgi:TPR repeat protein
VKADQHKAKRALQRGAALADPEALKNLAVMFRQGLGGSADQGAALKWYLAARAVGWPGLDAAVAELEGELSPRAARKAEDEARAWLAENKAPVLNPGPRVGLGPGGLQTP